MSMQTITRISGSLAVLVLVAACETGVAPSGPREYSVVEIVPVQPEIAVTEDTGTAASAGNDVAQTESETETDTELFSSETETASVPVQRRLKDFDETGYDVVNFDYNSFELTREAKAALDKQIKYIKAAIDLRDDLRVEIAGHCDERGTREYNLALGERRAAAVRNYLVQGGVPESRITTVSYGKERPVAFGSNEEAWSQNRRAETDVR